MKLKLSALFLFVFSLLFLFTPLKSAFADTYTLSGTVQDSAGHAIGGASVTVNDPNVDTTITDGTTGAYSFSAIPDGTYNIQVTPPSGSGFSSAIALNQIINSNTVLNFILTPAGSVSVSGHLLNEDGTPLQNQVVYLSGNGVNPSTTTDSYGYFSIQATPGTYTLGINNGSPDTNSPSTYTISTDNFSLNQDKVVTLTLPAKKVNVHVQDSSGNPISNVTVAAQGAQQSGLSLSTNITDAKGASYYNDSSIKTDSLGNVTLWLFPITTGSSYTLFAIPPSNSNYPETTLPNVSIISDSNETIVFPSSIILKGHLYNEDGTPLQNQVIYLSGNGVNPSTTTDYTGSYTIQATPGTYTLGIINGSTTELNAPSTYSISTPNFSLTQNTDMDITLPAKKVNVHIQDSSGNPISNVVLANQGTQEPYLSYNSIVTDATGTSYYNSTTVKTDSTGNVTLWLFPSTSGTPYTLIAIPPSGNNFPETSLPNVNIINDTSVTITLQTPVILKGHVYNEDGVPLQNQVVYLSGNGVNPSTTTDYSGNYRLEVLPGSYMLGLTNGSSTDLNAPSTYSISSNNFSLTQDTDMDITLPAKKITVHVQDLFNNPLAHITLATQQVQENNLQLSNTILDASGTSYYNSPDIQTDSSGNVILWLFPTSQSPYTLIAMPQSGSIYSQLSLDNVTFSGSQTEIVSLQYSHATPISTATISPNPISQGEYTNPVTVTLSATAPSGYTIANTYYTIDGGTQQTYTTPFTVSGIGYHTITYWSVDNSGVTETPKTNSFAIVGTYNLTGTVYIDANQNGVQDTGEVGYQGATLSLNSGQTATTDTNGNYSFSNILSGTYTETLSVSTGYSATTTNPATVPVSADSTVNFGVAPLPTPTATPTPTSTPTPTPTNTPTPTPTPANVAPVVSAITAPTTPVEVNTAMSASASFTDGNPADTHTVTWQWGDGSTSTCPANSAACTVTESNGSGTVSGNHTYTTAGIYTVTLTVLDNHGASTTSAPFNYVVVLDPSAGWVAGSKEFVSPIGAVVGNTNVTGTATFGFQAKYANGSMVPSGKNVSFSFPAGNITFVSTSYQWLVVNNPKAVFYANGTLNGVSGYTILISSIDQSSTHQNGVLRIQIKDPNQDVVYDTQPGDAGTADPITTVTKGQIAVH